MSSRAGHLSTSHSLNKSGRRLPTGICGWHLHGASTHELAWFDGAEFGQREVVRIRMRDRRYDVIRTSDIDEHQPYHANPGEQIARVSGLDEAIERAVEYMSTHPV